MVAFTTENADGNAKYFDGLAGSVANSCQAADDVTLTLGNPAEASTARALGFLSGAACTAIATPAAGSIASQREPVDMSSGAASSPRELRMPANPTPAQREVPGSL